MRETVNIMRCSPFSLLTDGLSDTGLAKIPLTVRFYNVNTSRNEIRFLDMCAMKGSDSATASSIFQKIDDALSLHGISWINCEGFGVDNTNVNLNWRQKFNQDKSKRKKSILLLRGLALSLNTQHSLQGFSDDILWYL